MTTQPTPEADATGDRIAGHSAAARGETGTDSDLPSRRDTGTAADTGGLPHTLTAGAAPDHDNDIAAADMTSDVGNEKDALREATRPGADAKDHEPRNETAIEQLGRPGRSG